MAPLDVQNLSYRYGEKTALDDVSFTLQEGRFHALLGPNGAGKSTLFSLLTRLFVAPEGRITIAGFDLGRQGRRALARMGVVFQQPTLDLDLSVQANLRYFAALQGISGKVADQRIARCLKRVSMAERAGETVRALNGGHRRRMEIARSLIHEPDILLLDEATVGLDAVSRADITAHVHTLAQEGLTVLWATHLVDEIAPEDEVIILHKGRILETGTAQDIAGDGTLTDAFLERTGS